MKPTTHLQLMPRSRNVALYIHSPIRLHSVVVKYIVKHRDSFTFIIIIIVYEEQG
jgi:hypothetical protein